MTSPIKTKQMFDQCFKLSKVRKRSGTKLVLICTRYPKLAKESLVVYAMLYIGIICLGCLICTCLVFCACPVTLLLLSLRRPKDY